MTINLPNGRTTFTPKVPEIDDQELTDYLNALRTQIDKVHAMAFDNADAIRSVINTGTSGSFVDSDGNTVTVVDGLITALA